MIKSLRVTNLRSIADSGFVNLRKINVLIGKNSSGKSTFLRIFPLLRQSVEVKTRSPILWYGRLVDFGSFETALRDGGDVRTSSFAFDFTDVGGKANPSVNRIVRTFGGLKSRIENVRCELELGGEDRVTSGKAKGLRISLPNEEVYIPYKGIFIKSIYINGKEFSPAGGRWYVQEGKLLPNLTLLTHITDEDGGDYFTQGGGFLLKEIAKQLRKASHKNTSDDTIQRIAASLTYDLRSRFYEQILRHPDAPQSLRASAREARSADNEIETVRQLLLCAALPALISDMDSQVYSFATSVRYLEPLRASAERYYRLQDLAVDEIDSRGSNTAMLLYSLDEHSKRLLSKWMESRFGFHAYTDSGQGHLTVNIAVSGSERGRNIADLGVGYSQILPIIIQLWLSGYSDTRHSAPQSGRRHLIAIEQPELHLHPHYQALIADVFAAVVSGREDGRPRNQRLVVETHSEHIVNRLGSLVSQGVLRKEDVGVLFFEERDGVTNIKLIELDSDGVLQEPWPLGFFIPES
jgi:predicted ATPase